MHFKDTCQDNRQDIFKKNLQDNFKDVFKDNFTDNFKVNFEGHFKGQFKFNLKKDSRVITSCQNPNLTTTQPKPNLNLVGFDTIITLHPPPPPHPGTLLLPERMVVGVWNFVGDLTKHI